MTQSLFQHFGALTLPVVAADVSGTGGMVALDPGRDILLGLFRQAIISELGGAWDQVRADLSVTEMASASVVNQTVPFDLRPQLARSFQFKFPVLAVYRTGDATFSEHTLVWDKLTQQWGVDYVLGPLPIEDVRRCGDILTAVAKTIALAIRRRGHPDYDSGSVQFFEDAGRFSSVRPLSYAMGPASFSDGADSPIYYTMSMKLETTELVADRDGFATDLEGASFTFGVGDGSQVLPAAVEADTDAIVEP